MSLLLIDGISMPSPGTLSVAVQDVNAARRRTLYGQACVSRASVRHSISCQWPYLTGDELKSLLNAVTKNAVFSVTYPDPVTGQARTVSVFCTERSVGLGRKDGDTPVWTNVRLAFSEV